MKQDFHEDASRDRLPLRLVVFKTNKLAGTIVLRKQGSTSLAEFQPELGGLFVKEAHRGLGIGTELVRAGMKVARDQGYLTVYATTVAATGILDHIGWEFVKTVPHHDEQLALYRCKL
jgi:GNAT superfamily N-acetyltransferase